MRDGDRRDTPRHRCVDVINDIPALHGYYYPAEVIRRIELYFKGGVLDHLSPMSQTAAQKGVKASSRNQYDHQPLTLHNAGKACDEFIRTIPPCPGHFQGRGIVICGGGIRYFTNAWVCINMLRQLNCQLPIQVWHLGGQEMDARMEAIMAALGVECIDASKVRGKFPVRRLCGWGLKPFAMACCPFREVLLLDADNVPVVNPEFLFETTQFQASGAIFWPDYQHGKNAKGGVIWRNCGLRQPDEAEFESGQIVIDKLRCWPALRLSLWLNENSDFYYQYLYGDKETFHIAFRKLKTRYSLVPHPIQTLPGTMCQHDFQGRRIFQHRNSDKWDLFLRNRQIEGFQFEKDCRRYVIQLRRIWDGGLHSARKFLPSTPSRLSRRTRPLQMEAIMISSPGRKDLRKRTIHNLTQTDWGDAPLHVRYFDDSSEDDFQKRQTSCLYLALKQSLEFEADYVLLLSDALDFNRHIRRNLQRWSPVKTRNAALASLYNPQVRELACDLRNNARIVAPRSVNGSLAFVMSKEMIGHLVHRWHRVAGGHEIKIPRLAGQLRIPVFYHAPSLVQHIGLPSDLNGRYHRAMDFDRAWVA